MLALSIDISSLQHPSNKPSKTVLFLLCIIGSIFSPRTKQKQTLNQTRVRNGQVSTTSVIMKDVKTGNKLFLIKNSYEEDISWITRIHLGKKSQIWWFRIPVMGKWRQTDLWGSLTSQSFWTTCHVPGQCSNLAHTYKRYVCVCSWGMTFEVILWRITHTQNYRWAGTWRYILVIITHSFKAGGFLWVGGHLGLPRV